MMLENHTHQAYCPISDDGSTQSVMESDDLLFEGYGRAKRVSKTSRKTRCLYSAGGLFALAVYSLLLIAATSAWWQKQRAHGANVIYSK